MFLLRFHNASIRIVKQHDRVLKSYGRVTSGHHKCMRATLRDEDLLDRLAGQRTDALSPEELRRGQVHGCDEGVRWGALACGECRIWAVASDNLKFYCGVEINSMNLYISLSRHEEPGDLICLPGWNGRSTWYSHKYRNKYGYLIKMDNFELHFWSLMYLLNLII